MKRNLFKGFTLAEVLITLAVIGVVAVLAIGIFMPKIQDRILAMQAKTAKIKFTKAMEQMALNNKIGPLYQDTEEFVSELQNYLKVAKVCDADKLADCFGYEKLIDADGKSYALSDATDGDIFGMPETNKSDFTGNTMGIVTIDGTPMVLAWNKKCEILEPGIYTWSGNTNASTSCVAALIDVNGTKKPDKLGKDIVLLNASKFQKAACIKFTINGTTYRWGCPFVGTPLSYAQCVELKNKGIVPSCVPENAIAFGENFWTKYRGDTWAGALQTCGGTAKLLSLEDLAALATYLYDAPSPIGATERKYTCPDNTKCLNMTKLSALAPLYDEYLSTRTYIYSRTQSNTKTGETFGLASNMMCGEQQIYYRSFSNTDSLYDWGAFRSSEALLAICKI